MLVHLPVPDASSCFRHSLLQFSGDHVDVVYPVVHEVHLPAPLDFAHYGFAHQTFVEFRDVGLDRQPLLRRRLHRRHIPQRAERHVKRARDRSRRKGQHVHLAAHLLQVLLVRHAEPLLLIDYDEPEVLEANVLLEQPVRPDDDIDRSRRQLLGHLPLLRHRPKAREHLNPSREGSEPLAEGLVVLLCQDRRGYEDGYLPALHHRLERRPHRHLRLPVANVSADEAVHRPG